LLGSLHYNRHQILLVAIYTVSSGSSHASQNIMFADVHVITTAIIPTKTMHIVLLTFLEDPGEIPKQPLLENVIPHLMDLEFHKVTSIWRPESVHEFQPQKITTLFYYVLLSSIVSQKQKLLRKKHTINEQVHSPSLRVKTLPGSQFETSISSHQNPASCHKRIITIVGF